jgi:molybdenum ABC transporter molybdate-binding protein
MPRLHLFGLFIALLLIQSCGRADVTVAADITLNPVMDSIVKEFTAKTGITMDITYGESGTLRDEMEGGREYDIFIPLGIRSFISSKNDKLEISGRNYFAEGEIVLLTTHKIPAPDSFAYFLLNHDLKRIAACDKKTSGIWEYFSHIIGYSFHDGGKNHNQIDRKCISARSDDQVISMVQSGDADAGIVTLSTLMALGQEKKVNWINLSEVRKKYPPYTLLMLGNLSTNQADAFQKFLLSPETEKWLERYHIHRNYKRY